MRIKTQLVSGFARMPRQFRAHGFFVVLCLALLVWLPAAAAARRTEGRASLAGLTGASFAIADFDGDSLPDLATVETGPAIAQHTNYWIQFEFSLGNKRSFAVSAPPGGLQIASRDVNGDHFLDVIISTQLANEPVAVLLNDGRGNFTLADAKKFAPAIWDARQQWQAVAQEVTDCQAALASPGWARGVENLRGREELPPAVTKVSAPGEKLRCFVVRHEVQGRAPPAA
jgi:hypothetical protein